MHGMLIMKRMDFHFHIAQSLSTTDHILLLYFQFVDNVLWYVCLLWDYTIWEVAKYLVEILVYVYYCGKYLTSSAFPTHSGKTSCFLPQTINFPLSNRTSSFYPSCKLSLSFSILHPWPLWWAWSQPSHDVKSTYTLLPILSTSGTYVYTLCTLHVAVIRKWGKHTCST